MKWFLNLKIGRKLAIGFGLLMIALVAVGGLSIVRMGDINAKTKLIKEEALEGIGSCIPIANDTSLLRLTEYRQLAAVDRAARQDAEETMTAALERLLKEGKDYEQTITAAQDRTNFDEFKKRWSAYMADHGRQVTLAREGKVKEGHKLLAQRRDTYLGAIQQLGVVVDFGLKSGAERTKEAEHSYTSARTLILTITFTAILLGALAGWFITVNITRPAQQITERMEMLGGACITDLGNAIGAMAQGDLTVKIQPKTPLLEIDTKDEFGKIAATFNAMRNSSVATIESYGRMQAGISALIAEVMTASERIAAGANEVSAGNEDLSQRTEEQASSLEETASSMEEMTSTVKQNAENSRQANQLAAQAREVAEKGGAIVTGAVSSMQEISNSSKKIADIISVIDEIAFQTNLLALNAAVEAARVGEQGKGFAVVAAEVRSLAGRSATAAKEIKQLVQESVARVSEGSQQVNTSGETLDEIVLSVKKVADIIAEIAAASQEQATGIEQVNKAVMQMDEITQQNAALVEEASAASHSMAQQASGLRMTVSQFKLDESYLRSAQQSVQAGVAAESESVWKATGTHGKPRTSRPTRKPVLKLAHSSAPADDFEEF